MEKIYKKQKIFSSQPPLPARTQLFSPLSRVWLTWQVSSKPDWTIKQLASRAEEIFRDTFRFAVSTALVLCPSRDTAAPFYELATDFFSHEVWACVCVCVFWGGRRLDKQEYSLRFWPLRECVFGIHEGISYLYGLCMNDFFGQTRVELAFWPPACWSIWAIGKQGYSLRRWSVRNDTFLFSVMRCVSLRSWFLGGGQIRQTKR